MFRMVRKNKTVFGFWGLMTCVVVTMLVMIITK